MMIFSPLGKTVTSGFTVEAGTESRFNALSAQPGSSTLFVSFGAKDSIPRRGLAETGLPAASGTRIASTD